MRAFRLWESVSALDQFGNELAAWHAHRTRGDTRGQHATQLALIRDEVQSALDALRTAIGNASGIAGSGDFFAELAAHNRRTIWVRKMFDFFRQRFDQRDDPMLGPVLKAADEVVWSCYRPFFAKRPPPSPLCCIEASYVPSAVRPDQAAHQLGRTAEIDDGPLAGYLRALPVAILNLPPGLPSAPWWLALIGHEVGHFVQRQTDDPAGFYDWLAAEIEGAAERAGGEAADKRAWRACTDEIFADWYFVLTMGPWAVWAVAPWLIGPQATMLTRQRFYPAPLIRLRMMAAMAERLGLHGADMVRLEGLDWTDGAAAGPQAALDRRIADEVAGIVERPLPDGSGDLGERIGFRATDFAAGKVVEAWSAALSGGRDRADDDELRTARLVAAGAVKASYDAALTADAGHRAERFERLRETAPTRIAACFEKGLRAAVTQPTPTRSLASVVLEASSDMLQRH